MRCGSSRLVSGAQRLTVNGLTVFSRCVAGVESCVAVPGAGFNLSFDVGATFHESINTPYVFVTHGHVDHVGQLVAHCATRGLTGRSPPFYFVPPCLQQPLEQLLDASRTMDGSDLRCSVVSVRPGDAIVLPSGKGRPPVVVPHSERAGAHTLPAKCTFVEVVPTVHRVPSQAYVVCHQTSQLKAEFRELAASAGGGAELGRLRREGVVITEPQSKPVLAYTGDTTIDALRDAPLLNHAEVLITECTAVDDKLPAAKCHERGHMHLDHFIDNAELFAGNRAVLLVHFSARYDPYHVQDALEARLPPALRAKTMWASAALDSGQFREHAGVTCCCVEGDGWAPPGEAGAGAGAGAEAGTTVGPGAATEDAAVPPVTTGAPP